MFWVILYLISNILYLPRRKIMSPEKLVDLAKEAMMHAYAPYSGFYVGAALLCAVGIVY